MRYRCAPADSAIRRKGNAMTISMYQASVPVFQKLLDNLELLLDKAAADATARKIDPSVFLQARLAPDMFAFARQVQIAADFAKGTPARLAGVEVPKYEDNESSFAELKARIKKTQDFIAGFKAAQIDGSETRDVTFKAGPRELQFKGLAYLLNFALPNFYFHYTMAYAILRHNGIALGKTDYVQGRAA
jgi:hypothetical protein